MEARQQAEKLYRKGLHHSVDVLGEETHIQLDKTIKKLLRDSLSKLDRNLRFKYKEFWHVIELTAKHGKLIPEKASEAFENLQKYFILLLKTPWKKEFRKLTTYCGYFQSKIKSHLENPESIICLVGFVAEGTNALVLKGEPDLQKITSVAFECVVAVVECEMIAEFHRKLKESGANVCDVVRWRDTGDMPEPKVKEIFDDEVVMRNGVGAKSSSSFYDRESGYMSNKGSIRNKSTPHPGAGLPRNLPYIDEDDPGVDDANPGYEEGTIEEHLLASLRRVSQTAPHREQTPSASEDWAFVRDGLETRYGAKYFEGSRGDVIRNPRNDAPARPPEDLSDEGIDVAEEPPAVNLMYQPMMTAPLVHRTNTLSTQDRSVVTRESGYRTDPSQIYYPPVSHSAPVSPGTGSLNTSAYVSQQSSFNSQMRQPLVARGGGPPMTATDLVTRPPGMISRGTADRNFRYPSQGITPTGQLMSRHLNDLGARPSGGQWPCATCTLLNDNHKFICDGCGRSREKGPEIDGPQCGDSITECKKCTFENQPGTKTCIVCDSPLETSHVHTYV